MTAKKNIIVTAADDLYLPLVIGLLQSLRSLSFLTPFDIGVLDVGLGDAARQTLSAYGVTFATPKTDIDYPDRARWEQMRPAYRAQTSRPFLRDYFSGYDVYMWMDADSWAQTPDAIDTMLSEAAASDALHIASEIDRAYTPYFLSSQPWSYHLDWYRANYPAEMVQAIFPRPMLNVGVFALRADAPAWKPWAELYAFALNRVQEMSDKQFMCDQLSLNMAVYLNGLPLRVMPAEYNWLTLYALPAYDETRAHYVRPTAPREVISVMHLTHKGKLEAQEIRSATGAPLLRALTAPMLTA